MKKLNFLIVFVCGMFISYQSAAHKASGKVKTKVTLTDDFGIDHTFIGDGVEIKGKSGNYLRTVQIKVPKDILECFVFEPYANIWIVGKFEYDSDGDDVVDTKVWDSKAFLNKSGHLSVVFHNNGAGRVIPRGY